MVAINITETRRSEVLSVKLFTVARRFKQRATTMCILDSSVCGFKLILKHNAKTIRYVSKAGCHTQMLYKLVKLPKKRRTEYVRLYLNGAET